MRSEATMDNTLDEHLIQLTRTNDYSYRVPTPPRILIPPPRLDKHSIPKICLGRRPEVAFLRDVNYEALVTSNALLDWTYERRREAQKILPYIFLGPLTSAKDANFLRNEGITMLVGICQKNGFSIRAMEGAMRSAREMGLDNETFTFAQNSDIITAFPQITAQINAHLSKIHDHAKQGQQQGASSMGKVLVFCESGNDRSAAVVAAYIMEMYPEVDHCKAMQLCQAQRFCVNFDEAIKSLLQSYWDILRARRDTAATPPQNLSTKRSKRVMEVDYDMADAGEPADAARFERRTFAPFIDSS